MFIAIIEHIESNAAAIIIPKLVGSNTASTRITTYNVNKVTYGNITQTISGSGTLTPVTKKTLTSAKGGSVDKVNFTVGDEVTKGDEIAVINGESITAPCDGIILELPLAAGDEVAKGVSPAAYRGSAHDINLNFIIDSFFKNKAICSMRIALFFSP